MLPSYEITQHGKWWARDDIDSTLMGLPPCQVIVREGDAAEWYAYQKQFESETIKATVLDGVILNAVVDVSLLYPAGQTIIEINDPVGVPSSYIGRGYDADKNALVA